MIYFYDNYNPDKPNNVINYIDFNTTKTFIKSFYSIIHKNKGNYIHNYPKKFAKIIRTKYNLS